MKHQSMHKASHNLRTQKRLAQSNKLLCLFILSLSLILPFPFSLSMLINIPPLCGTTKCTPLKVIDLRTYTDRFFFLFLFYLWQFLLKHCKMYCREFSADLGLSAWARQKSTFTSLLQPPRRPCLPTMTDGPILNLPSSFQRLKYFFFFF